MTIIHDNEDTKGQLFIIYQFSWWWNANEQAVQAPGAGDRRRGGRAARGAVHGDVLGEVGRFQRVGDRGHRRALPARRGPVPLSH